ncbi:MAG: MBL fold metallo-hydrolase [Rothia sp. (in: high G+C Gram-positive bacteria)]|nr:MBL fold metallo-hydrolase [Rothia sp. (in: high G+C Gram-positive bacteria)]
MTEAGNLLYDTDAISIRSLSVSEMDNNVYLLTSKVSRAQVLIDAAAEFEHISKFVTAAAGEDLGGEDGGVQLAEKKPVAVITTHSHWDHIRALPAAVEAFTLATYCGAADAAAIEQQEGVQVQNLLTGGELLTFGDIELEVIALRGHTPGSIALVYRGNDLADSPTLIFTGDSLFPGGVGKTNSPEDFKQLLGDVRERIFDVFDDNTVVLPGHGKHTTLGADRGNLGEWEARGW